jgi:hypothetical protein
MSLDINTPKGQLSLIDEEYAIGLFENNNFGWTYLKTPKDSPCVVDGMLAFQSCVRAVVETKCRDMTLEQLQKFNMEWLVTAEKIMKGIRIAEDLYVPFYGFLYLIPDKTLLVKEIWNPKKGLMVEFSVIRTTTQATINGGSIERANAYIKMDESRMFK